MSEKTEKNYFEKLNSLDVSGKTEKKNGLTYLSWAWAWGELKKIHPDAYYTIYENANGLFYHTDGKTAWVKTGVTVNGIEHIEYLPVMDFRNNSVPVDAITSVQVNKTIQRSLTKAVARHGLGLYIYAGEDLPEEKTEAKTVEVTPESRNSMIAKIVMELKNHSQVKIDNIMATYEKATDARVSVEKNLARLTDAELADALKKFEGMKK